MLTYLYRKLYIVDNLRIKIFIKNNIIKFKEIVINVINKKVRINNYSITINIIVRSRDEFIRRKIYIKVFIFVSSHSEIMLLIKKINLFNNRDFLFKLI